MSQGKEDENRPNYDFFVENCSRNPYDSSRAVWTLLASNIFQYPIRFEDGATMLDGKPLEHMQRLMADTKETAEKVIKIRGLAMSYLRFRVVDRISSGAPLLIQDLLEGDLSLRCEPHVPEYPIKTEPVDERFKTVLKRCFISSFQNREESDKQQDIAIIGPLLKTEQYQRELQLYQQLKTEGVKEIDPESLGMWLIPIIRDILSKHPRLKPIIPEAQLLL